MDNDNEDDIDHPDVSSCADPSPPTKKKKKLSGWDYVQKRNQDREKLEKTNLKITSFFQLSR